jgi:hypothetical protein
MTGKQEVTQGKGCRHNRPEPRHLRRRAKRGMLPLGAAGRQTSARMKMKRRFPDDVLAVLREGKGLRIRAGISQHLFIGQPRGR